eukprot:gene22880-biopygen20779
MESHMENRIPEEAWQGAGRRQNRPGSRLGTVRVVRACLLSDAGTQCCHGNHSAAYTLRQQGSDAAVPPADPSLSTFSRPPAVPSPGAPLRQQGGCAGRAGWDVAWRRRCTRTVAPCRASAGSLLGAAGQGAAPPPQAPARWGCHPRRPQRESPPLGEAVLRRGRIPHPPHPTFCCICTLFPGACGAGFFICAVVHGMFAFLSKGTAGQNAHDFLPKLSSSASVCREIGGRSLGRVTASVAQRQWVWRCGLPTFKLLGGLKVGSPHPLAPRHTCCAASCQHPGRRGARRPPKRRPAGTPRPAKATAHRTDPQAQKSAAALQARVRDGTAGDASSSPIHSETRPGIGDREAENRVLGEQDSGAGVARAWRGRGAGIPCSPWNFAGVRDSVGRVRVRDS